MVPSLDRSEDEGREVVALRVGLAMSAQSLRVQQLFKVQLQGQKTAEGDPMTRRGQGCLLL